MPNERAATRKRRKVSLFESSMKTVGITKVGSLSLGFAITLLVLLSDLMKESTAVQILLVCVVLLVLACAFAILLQEVERPGFGSWGVIGLFLLGSALGVLAYHWGEGIGDLASDARRGITGQWLQYKNLGGLSEVIFAGLFLFGVIMAVFVVRVWNKAQDDFMKSVATALGGAAIPPLLGKTIAVDASQAFAAYFLGFAISAAVNVILCARLLAYYSNKRTVESRAVLSFLYGSDKAETVDKQFLKNFEDDPDYAKRLLITTVLEYEKRVRREFANKREQSRQEKKGTMCYYELIAIECKRKQGSEPAAVAPKPPAGAPQPPPAGAPQPPPADAPQPPTAGAPKPPPADAPKPPNVTPAAVDEQVSATTPMKIVFRKIDDNEPLTEKMFRSAVSLKWQDNLEFIDAAAAYTQSFPLFGSVTGLALEVLNTIVMDRDKYRRFRTTSHPQGLCPADSEQMRGLDEIDYLSYIVVPVASHLGQPEQTKLGVLHVDSKLFAVSPEELKIDDEKDGILTATLRPVDLTEYANKMYDQDDIGVKYLEEMRAVLVPVLELYLKCRQGSA